MRRRGASTADLPMTGEGTTVGSPPSEEQAQGPAPSPKASDAAAASGVTEASTAFDCNICFETPTDPVVTRCGHLYCWKCLYTVRPPPALPPRAPAPEANRRRSCTRSGCKPAHNNAPSAKQASNAAR